MRLVATLIVAVVVSSWYLHLGGQAQGGTTVFEGARLIVGDGSPPIENATFVVEGTRFTQVGRAGQVKVPARAARVDLKGKTVMPGIIDTHTHMPATRTELVDALQRKAYYGVSVVMSLGTDPGDLAFQVRGETIPNAARLLTAGRGLTTPEPGRTDVPYWITTTAEARKAVQELASKKPDLVKIWVDDRNGKYKKLTPDLYGAIIDEAHKHGLRVTAHIYTLGDAKGLMRAGIDAFAHSIREKDIDDEFMEMVKERRRVVLVPNLPDRGVATDLSWLRDSVPAGELKKLQAGATDRSAAQEAFAIQARNLARLNKLGMPIALGTDGNVSWSHHIEMEDMVAGGMTPSQVIVAATRNAANVLALKDHGTIAAGKVADFLVLDANPLVDIKNTRRISAVYLRGAPVDRAAMRARWMTVEPEKSPFDALRFRDIGPAVTSGRLHDIQINPKDPAVLYVAAATGGIWKSTNKGVTWTDIFGKQPDNTFGALAIFEGNTNIIWAGSGENNNRQSSSWGGGVYRSTDGGATWTHLGLRETRAIGRVVLDPKDPNVAYVAAVGNLWRENPERGVFKTTDAGRTWTKVLYVDHFTGATDLVMDPRDSRVLYAATYQRLRKAFGFNGGGPGSAIYKTTDAGVTWNKLANGIPEGDKGRIGLALAVSKPDVLIATIEHPTASGTYRTEDAGATWTRMSATNPRPMYYSKPTIDPNNDRRIWLPGVDVHKSEDAGATFIVEPTSPTYDVGLKTDHHVIRVDPANSNHIYVAGDGGLHESFDLGKTYIRVNNIPVSQIYRVAVDNRDPYWVYVGLQDNHSFMAPSATRHWLGILNQDWVEIGFSDGTGKAVDKSDGRKVYSSSSGGNLSLVDPMTGDILPITPRPPTGEPAYRFDWDAPVMASRHTSGAVYLGGNRLFTSKDFGSTWTRSKDLTRSIDRDAIPMMGVLNRDIRLSRNDGDNISEISNFAESPIDPKILWVGTDDGNVQLTRDGGDTWTELSGAIKGVKDGTFVGDIVASGASPGTAYVSFDAHRDGDFAPYIFRTTDFGKSWTAAITGLPTDDASIRGLSEFPGKPNVLFTGTERALFVTHDSGARWTRINANLPTTRYDDIVIHPRTKDLVLATHGRGVWILDDASPIAEWTAATAAKRAHLFDVPRATLMLYWGDVSNMSHFFYTAENPAEGATFSYHLAQPAKKVRLIVAKQNGKVIRSVDGPVEANMIHRVNWDLRYPVPPGGGGRGAGGGGEEGGGAAATQRPGAIQLPVPSHDIGPRGAHIAPGTFKVTLEVDGVVGESKTFEVRGDPASALTLAQHEAREAFVVEIMDLQGRVEALAADLATRRKASTGEAATRFQVLEQRLVGGGGGGRGSGGGRGGGVQPLRQRLSSFITAFVGSGARTGSVSPPTGQMRDAFAEVKADFAAIEKASTTP